MSRRYRIKADGPNRAILTLCTGLEFHYWAPIRGGFVRRETPDRPGTLGEQVCDGLEGTGECLYWYPDGRRTLDVVIRREARTRAGSARIDDLIEKEGER